MIKKNIFIWKRVWNIGYKILKELFTNNSQLGPQVKPGIQSYTLDTERF